MEIELKYFGQTAELVGHDGEILREFNGRNLGDLIQLIESRHPEMDKIPVQYAVNQKISSEECALSDQDEVSVFPPFAGG